LVKLIVTVPAFAVSVLLVNLSAPLGSADWASVLLAPAAALDVLADVDVVPVVAAVLVALVAAGVLDVVLLAPVGLQIAHLLCADLLWAALVVLAARMTVEPVEAN
jgi:hypothetical protein